VGPKVTVRGAEEVYKASATRRTGNNLNSAEARGLERCAPQARNLTRRSAASCLILQYHRVALLCQDPLQLAVEPYKLEEQMQYLAESCHVIPLSVLKQHLDTATPFADRTVAVTFDGGYADVLYTAADVLNRYQVPATVFAASAGLLQPSQFWWHTLQELLIAGDSCHPLELEIDGNRYTWPLHTCCQRFRAYEQLYSNFCDRTPAEQQGLLEQIASQLECLPAERDSHRLLDADELRRLQRLDLITLGGHTHDGVKLASLNRCRQTEQISQNKTILEELLGQPVEYFSYPFGSDGDCTSQTAGILQELGFSLGCGNGYGLVAATGEVNCYDLPRVKVGNWGAFTLHRLLERFFGEPEDGLATVPQ
jgi:peptidoglycan/xylan/chitin deacetylase (PgdA/CDA1 family)